MQTTLLPTPTTGLPSSVRLGATLTGPGAVERKLLTWDESITGIAIAPLDDGALALQEGAAMPIVVFESRLRLSASGGLVVSK